MNWFKRLLETIRAYSANEEPRDLSDYNPVPRRHIGTAVARFTYRGRRQPGKYELDDEQMAVD